MDLPILPDELQKQLDKLAGEFVIFIHTQQYDLALTVIKGFYSRMLDWQKKCDQRFHKGYPLHNIGYTLSLQKKHVEALKYFILAYIEDCLSSDNENEIDSAPAGQTLLIGYKLHPELLKPLKTTVQMLKGQGRIIFTPEEVLKELEKSTPDYEKSVEKEKVEPKDHPKRKFTLFSTEWAKRVFIGGSGDPIINQIRDIVDGIGGYDPVVVVDFDMPKEITIYNKCLALLHSCKYAIFDLTIPGGQIIEIERAPDYGIKTLAVCAADKEHNITQVLKSCLEDRKIVYKSYTSFSELENIIKEFLKES